MESAKRHRAARRLAGGAPLPTAAEEARATPASVPVLPYLALACALGAGILAIGYTWLHLEELPARIPVHFGWAGRPDAYRPRSSGFVWMLPIMTLCEGSLFGMLAVLIARAKGGARRGGGARSSAAQTRFRSAMSNFLAIIALGTTALLATLSIGLVRVSIGAAAELPHILPVMVVLLIAVVVGGLAFLALRMGHWRALREGAAGTAPLAGGLAEDRRWVLGMFYADRDDPALFVERRFGFGYTLNFGNRKAAPLLALILLVVLGLAVAPWLLR